MNISQGASRGSGNIAWTISRRLGMVIVLALAFFLSAIVTIYTLFRSGDTQVPNIVGRSQTEAQKLAGQAGLRVKIQMRNDVNVPANSVIETRPGANSSVKKDSVLTIVVSSGPQTKSKNLSVSAVEFLVSRCSGRWQLGREINPGITNPKPETASNL
jgi:hypothetical protein